jgi:hypothetical protein
MAAKKSRPTSTKFAREAKLRERRLAKQARKDARKEQALADSAPDSADGSSEPTDEQAPSA